MFNFSNVSLCVRYCLFLSAQVGARCSICNGWKTIMATHEAIFFFNMHFTLRKKSQCQE